MITEQIEHSGFEPFRGWGDWTLRTLLVLGVWFAGKTLAENKPWQGVIVGFSTAQAEEQADPVLDESIMADRFKKPAKPLAWAVPR